MIIYAESIGGQLNNYISYLNRSKQGKKDLPAGYTIREEPEPHLFQNLDEDALNH